MAVAKTQLFAKGGILAHNPGDFVPDENVEPNGWGDGVEKDEPDEELELNDEGS